MEVSSWKCRPALASLESFPPNRIAMKQIFILLLLAVLSVGCGKKKPEKPADKYSDPKFQSAQRAQAVRAYEELVKTYPDSKHADEAKQRLLVIQK